jgi:hypothetical protein
MMERRTSLEDVRVQMLKATAVALAPRTLSRVCSRKVIRRAGSEPEKKASK